MSISRVTSKAERADIAAQAREYKGTKAYLLSYSEMITAATRVQKLAALMGLPDQGNLTGREVGRLLGEIVEEEVRSGRPILSAVAVNTKGEPSDGFFVLATGSTKEERSVFWVLPEISPDQKGAMNL